ncbi:MAG: hypothetical protein QNJ31_07695 [Candidatus Caenarcaniphilales bacterium]|nr:hypothetical protein [Candidatus Caenarcaniphilales bacterium]
MKDYKQEDLIKFLKNQRWFQSKSKRIQKIATIDQIEFNDIQILILEIEFNDFGKEQYFLPLSINEGTFQDDLNNENFLQQLFTKLTTKQSLQTAKKQQISLKLMEGSKFTVSANSSFKLLGVEQSNTSIIIDRQFIVKFIRKLGKGINPETEILEALNPQKLDFIPRLEAKICFETDSGETLLASIQKFIDNQGDGWRYCCNLLINLNNKEAILRFSQALANKTAQMHIALSQIHDDECFSMEDFNDHDLEKIKAEFNVELEKSLSLVKISGYKKEFELLEEIVVDNFLDVFEELIKKNIKKIRIHGDYHLGQVLKTQDSYIIIDFEGEPLKPVEKRKQKTSPLKDVAGMLRSFDYAFESHLKSSKEISAYISEEYKDLLGETKNKFLYEYLSKVIGRNFVFDDIELNKKLIRVYEIEKALYEVNYEINNRPDWLDIPINSLKELLAIN